MIKRIISIIVFFVFFHHETKAQNNDDFRTRTGIELSKDLRNGFQLGLQYQVRTFNNASNFQGSYFTISPSYKINSSWSTQLDIRYATSRLWDRFRFAYYINAQHKVNKFKYSFRLGYLHEIYLQEFSDINQYMPTNNFRARLRAEHKILKKTKLLAGVEPVISLNNQLLSLRQFRNTLGLNWEFTKNNELSVEYMWQPFFQQSYQSSNHSIIVNYTINIPKFKKKKK
jgi:hypothetical protein